MKWWSRKRRKCIEIETVRGLIYLGDKVKADIGCEAAVTARTRCWRITFCE